MRRSLDEYTLQTDAFLYVHDVEVVTIMSAA